MPMLPWWKPKAPKLPKLSGDWKPIGDPDEPTYGSVAWIKRDLELIKKNKERIEAEKFQALETDPEKEFEEPVVLLPGEEVITDAEVALSGAYERQNKRIDQLEQELKRLMAENHELKERNQAMKYKLDVTAEAMELLGRLKQ